MRSQDRRTGTATPIGTGRSPGRTALWILLLALVAAGCGYDGGAAGAPDETAAPTPSATASPTARAPTPSPPTATDAPDPGVEGAGDETEGGALPGEDASGVVGEGPYAVVGVAADDTLNLRATPGVDGEILAELPPLSDGLEPTGQARSVDGGVWFEIVHDGVTGWANARYLAVLGDTNDITSELPERPSGATLPDIAEAVFELRKPESEGDGPSMVVTDGPSEGDLGEITIDILGWEDDAILGERLHLFAQPDAGGEGFTLRTVEQTILCARGVSDGLCL